MEQAADLKSVGAITSNLGVRLPSPAPYVPITQLAEYATFNRRVESSNLSRHTKTKRTNTKGGWYYVVSGLWK